MKITFYIFFLLWKDFFDKLYIQNFMSAYE